MALQIPDPNTVFPNAYKTSCFLKNVVQAPNVTIGDYTYYDDPQDPTGFEKNNILFNYPEFGDRLTIGKFCCLASGGAWEENAPPHLDQLPRKGDTVVGNDVWLGRESVVMPGVRIGDGAIVAAYSVVTKDVAPYTLVGGNPARFLKNRFNPQLTQLLLEAKWWDWDPAALAEALPMLCSPNLEQVKAWLRDLGYGAAEI